MTSFWEKTQSGRSVTIAPEQIADSNIIVLDNEAMTEIQGDPNLDLFEEEDEDLSQTMTDANLRLEQGRLYQMVLQGNIFADTNADPRAIRNVQRQIKKFVTEQMEVMLGMRQELAKQEAIISSPFNDMEVTALKMIASKVTKGATEAPQPTAVAPVQPKKDGISSISGSLRPNDKTTPLVPAKQLAKPTPVQKILKQPVKSAVKAEESALTKPINEMTQEELTAHNAAAEERSRRNRAAMPTYMTPHPTAQQLEAQYTIQAANLGVANPVTKFRPY